MLGSSPESDLHGKIVVVDLSYLMHRSYKASIAGSRTTEIVPYETEGETRWTFDYRGSSSTASSTGLTLQRLQQSR